VNSVPILRGGLVARAVWLVAGLFLCALGVLSFLESRLGLPPWDVLHQGIAKCTPLSFGLASVVVGIVVLAVVWSLGGRIGVGTISNAILIGSFIALLQPLHVVSDVSQWPVLPRALLLIAGLVCFGLGSAFYIGAALGAGPRDSLMLVGTMRTGVRIGAIRALIEVSVLAAGFVLGGTVGLGTVVFALLIGPAVEASFWLVSRTALT
jgi:uncharacterized membrane protein YczE